MEGSQMKVGCMPFTSRLALSILEGRKTQTRRVIPDRITANADIDKHDPTYFFVEDSYGDFYPGERFAPYQAGSILWIREPGKIIDVKDYGEDGMDLVVEYLADGKCAGIEVPPRLSEVWESKYEYRAPNWVLNHQGIPNGIFKEAARLFVKVVDVRVERIANISKADERAEGMSSMREGPVQLYNFQELWDSIAKDGEKWTDNPWVWAYTFETTDKPANWPTV
jgi:hypothetical protein